MRIVLKLNSLLAIFVLLGAVGCTPQTEFEVATWRGFKQCAVSYTMEDSYDNQFKIALPIFYEYDYPCTFFLTTRWCDKTKWDALRIATTERDCEVGSHTVDHAVYDTLTKERQKQDILDANARINVKLPMYKCNTFAHTNCVVGDTSILSKHYFAARGCHGYVERPTPDDYLNISSLMCGSNEAVRTLDDFKDGFNTARKMGGWCIFSLYDIDGGDGYSPLSSDVLRESLAYLKSQEKSNSYWVTTFKNAAKYSKERDAAKVTMLYSSADKLTVMLEDGLDDELYDYPLTLRCPLPFGWKEVEVLQNEVVIKSEVKTINGCKYVIFDAVPNGNKKIYLINLE
ncbi:MAG: polysaccharide deacetylase family protein [Paludibacteraceae bacterium]|nr:polysaccharide deacetylase family protein [Paludibacteraceae bacterium]